MNQSQSKMSFWRNDEGKVVLWQNPNLPLTGWLIFLVTSWMTKDTMLASSLRNMSMAFLFTWAYMELIGGENYFRKTLG